MNNMDDTERFWWWLTTVVLVVFGLSAFLSGHFILGTFIFIGLAITEILIRRTW